MAQQLAESNLQSDTQQHDPTDEEHFSVVVSGLVGAIGMQLLAVKVDPQINSTLRLNLDQTIAAAFACLAHSNLLTQRHVLGFINMNINSLRTLKTSKTHTTPLPLQFQDVKSPLSPPLGGISAVARQAQNWRDNDQESFVRHLPRLLDTILLKYHFPPQHDNFPVLRGEEDEEDEFTSHRKDLYKMYITLTRCASTEVVLPFLERITHAVFASRGVAHMKMNDVEVVLSLVFHFGEGASDFLQTPKKQANPGEIERFTAVLGMIFQSDASFHPHPLVVYRYNEVVTRYAHYFGVLKDLHVAVVQGMVGARGVQHPHFEVRQRSAYNLIRVTKTLSNMRIFDVAPRLLVGLQDVLSLSLETFRELDKNAALTTSSPALLRRSRSFDGTLASKDIRLTLPSLLNIFELVGHVIYTMITDPDLKTNYLKAVLGPLHTSLVSAKGVHVGVDSGVSELVKRWSANLILGRPCIVSYSSKSSNFVPCANVLYAAMANTTKSFTKQVDPPIMILFITMLETSLEVMEVPQ